MTTPSRPCPGCGTEASGRFCSHCGASLEPASCRSCQAPLTSGAKFCHRCGTATTDPVRKPAAVRPRRSGLFSVVGIAALALLGLFLGQAGRTMGPGQGGLLETVAAICVGTALVILVVRIVRRRR